MHARRSRAPWLTVAVGLVALFGAARVRAQAIPADAPEDVRKLIRQLDAEAPEDRDKAEEELAKRGVTVLPHLDPNGDRRLSAEQKRRLGRLVRRIRQEGLAKDIAGRTLRPIGRRPLSEAIAELTLQSGNEVRDQRGDEAPDPLVEWTGPITYWRALDELAAKAGAAVRPSYEGRASVLEEGVNRSPIAYAGAFRFRLERITLTSDFEGETGPECSLDIEGQIEPRLQPLLLESDPEDWTATDDAGRVLATLDPSAIRMAFERETPRFELHPTWRAPQRGVASLARIEGKLNIWMPTQRAEFVFHDLTSPKVQYSESLGLKAELRPMRDEEGLWALPVVVDTPLADEELESHLRTSLEPEVGLRRKNDGKLLPHDGPFSSLPADQGRTGMEYVFVDMPGKPADYEVVIRVPAGLESVPVTLIFTNLPLP